MILRFISVGLTVSLYVCSVSFAESSLKSNRVADSNGEALKTFEVSNADCTYKVKKITLRDGRIIHFDPDALIRPNTAEKPKDGENSPITSPTLGNNNKEAIAAAKERGAATALSDIKAGKRRILLRADYLIGELLTIFQQQRSGFKPFPFVDDATGFPVQIVGISLVFQGCGVSEAFVAEVESYNHVMCSWSEVKTTEIPKK